MRNLRVIIIFFIVCLHSNSFFGQVNSSGKLFIIGGGDRSSELMNSMILAAELGPDDYIVVLPMASSIPDTVFHSVKNQINALSKNNVVSFNFKKDLDILKTRIDSLKQAKLIYITGGDQNKFMEVVLNNKIHKAIKYAYNNGSTIAGTSAGAAVMSKIMITGGQLKQKEVSDFKKIEYKNVEISEGLGLLENVIIDQHFIVRSRYNRLISVIAENPDHIGIGIDESTAVLIENNTATILGEAQVVVISNPDNLSPQTEELIKFTRLNFALLGHGQKIDLK